MDSISDPQMRQIVHEQTDKLWAAYNVMAKENAERLGRIELGVENLQVSFAAIHQEQIGYISQAYLEARLAIYPTRSQLIGYVVGGGIAIVTVATAIVEAARHLT